MIFCLFNLKDKVIVVTGAAGLLGRKHAEVIARYGGTPILLDLSQQNVDKSRTYFEKTCFQSLFEIFICEDFFWQIRASPRDYSLEGIGHFNKKYFRFCQYFYRSVYRSTY